MSPPVWLLLALNLFFLVFHTGLIVFNAIGWGWRRTRRLHLLTVSLTAASWLIMGFWKGVGYCVCTDWHWQIRRALGIHDPENTYIQFLVRVLTGFHPSESAVRVVTGVIFGTVAILSITLNLRDRAKPGTPTK